jgi:hypothetical protein
VLARSSPKLLLNVVRESFSPLDNQPVCRAARRFLTRLRRNKASIAKARTVPITTEAIIPGLRSLSLEGIAPASDPLPPPSTGSSPPPVELSPEVGIPGPEWETCVASVLTPEMVVKAAFPESSGLSEGSLELEFCELGPEMCTEPFWDIPLSWGGDNILMGDELEGSDGLEPGRSRLEVGVDG